MWHRGYGGGWAGPTSWRRLTRACNRRTEPRDPVRETGRMAVRWAAAAFLDAEKNYRRTMGYRGNCGSSRFARWIRAQKAPG